MLVPFSLTAASINKLTFIEVQILELLDYHSQTLSLALHESHFKFCVHPVTVLFKDAKIFK